MDFFAWFDCLSCQAQALMGGLFTWSVTALGAAMVFFFKRTGTVVLDAMLGFAGGVMLAASCFSLLLPGIELARELNMTAWVIASAGFMAGGAILYACDRIYTLLGSRDRNRPSASKRRCALLIYSITMHNIPEGMAIGIAFGSAVYGISGATVGAACLLALGVGIQNFPEGAAVSVPLMRDGVSKPKAFLVGQLSGVVEPISASVGALLAVRARAALPLLLSFAAGAMVYVVVEELIPESLSNGRKALIALFTLAGFSAMMILDVALG